MKIHDRRADGSPREVTLTVEEMQVYDAFHEKLDEGWGIPRAAHHVLHVHRRGPSMSEEFALFLSDGTVTMNRRCRPTFTEKYHLIVRGE